MSKQKLSAKDKAFEQERIKFRREIHEKEHLIQNLRSELRTKNQEIQTLQSKIQEQNDWIERLLEYMDIPEDQFKAMIKNAQVSDNLTENVSRTLHRLFKFTRAFSDDSIITPEIKDNILK